MNTRRGRSDRRRGVSLLEVMTALSLSATMMTSSFVVLRSSYTAWRAHDADLERAGAATAVLRHLSRNVRQATGVTAISAAADTSGAMTLVDETGSALRWEHSGASVTLSVDGGAAQPVADEIQALTFVGYQADGVTPTTDPNEVQAIRAIVTTPLPVGGTRTISSFVWIRSW